MSATVTYKGATLTTVTNQTRTLETAGTYLEDDITIVDVTSGGGSVTQDENGFIILPSTGGGSPSVGGLEYEAGTWTPSEDVSRGEILFNNTHTVPPMYAVVSNATNTDMSDNTFNVACAYIDFYRITGSATDAGATTKRYGLAAYTYKSSATNTSQAVNAITSTSDDTDASSTYKARYWATPTAFYPYCNNGTKYWKANRTYKWIAVWAPTT